VSAKQTLRILVVDDDRLFREMLSEALRSEGHPVTTAVDGADGLHEFKTSGFDVVITDLEMPRLSGQELAAAVKALSPGTVVIAVSGDPTLGSARALMSAGCEGLLPKAGLSTADILQAIGVGCERQRAVRALAAHEFLELARREVALGVLNPLAELTGQLELLAGGTLGIEKATRLAAKSLAAARRIRESLEAIGREKG
jgi:CheY-like chemotaxis protein